jgi:AraC-like DNA-binding protein
MASRGSVRIADSAIRLRRWPPSTPPAPFGMGIQTASRELLDLLQSSRLRFLRSWRHQCPPISSMHQHDCIELIWRASGEGDAWGEDGRIARFAAGAVTVYPPRVPHAQRMRRTGEDVCVHIAVDGALPPELRQPIEIAAGGDLTLLQQFDELARQPADDDLARAVRDHLVRAVLGRVVALALVAPGAADHVARAQAYLAEHYAELGSLDEVAAHLGIGPDHLRHRFKERTGRSLIDHLTAVRVARARDLLAHSTLPLDQVARQCGYATGRHLSAVFRRAVGSAPGEWRRRARRRS